MTGYTYPIALKLACDAMHHLGMGPEEIEQVIETIKQRGVEAARDEMQASIDGAVKQMQATAWDEGAQAADVALGRMFRNEVDYIEPDNPYRQETER